MKATTNLVALAVMAISAISCKKESDTYTTTYQDVKPIIDKTCAYAGCHAGAAASAWLPAEAKKLF
jgi:hypothetical protein